MTITITTLDLARKEALDAESRSPDGVAAALGEDNRSSGLGDAFAGWVGLEMRWRSSSWCRLNPPKDRAALARIKI